MNSVVLSEPYVNQHTVDQRKIYYAAVEALRYGINVLPISGDGSKRPPIKWERYQHQRATLSDLQSWFLFARWPGLAFITGTISSVELLDFDTMEIYQQWSELMEQQGQGSLLHRLTAGYLEASPHGIHLLYRSSLVEGNQKSEIGRAHV